MARHLAGKVVRVHAFLTGCHRIDGSQMVYYPGDFIRMDSTPVSYTPVGQFQINALDQSGDPVEFDPGDWLTAVAAFSDEDG